MGSPPAIPRLRHSAAPRPGPSWSITVACSGGRHLASVVLTTTNSGRAAADERTFRAVARNDCDTAARTAAHRWRGSDHRGLRRDVELAGRRRVQDGEGAALGRETGAWEQSLPRLPVVARANVRVPSARGPRRPTR